MIDCYFTKITQIFGYGWVLEDGAPRSYYLLRLLLKV